MLIVPDKLKLAKYLGKNNKIHALDNLFFDQNKTTVSNDYYLIQVEDTTQPSYKNFPHINGMENTDYIPDKVLVTANTATKVLKNLSKNKKLSILNNTSIEMDRDGTVSFGSTDLESSIVIRQRKKVGEYPDVDNCITKNEPKAKVVVDAKHLQKIASAFDEFLSSRGTNGIEIFLFEPGESIMFRAQKDNVAMTSILVPLGN